MQQVLSEAERFRLKRMSIHEKRLTADGYSAIAGIDEAGRGPLAGPVVAVACILSPHTTFEHLNDSKQLTSELRERLYTDLSSDPGTRFGLGVSDVLTIDRVNILQATFLAMRQAVMALKMPPDYLLIDGKHVPTFDLPSLAIIKGDTHSVSIAAASILAKVTRDRMMVEFDLKWPHYGFKKHKGYATEEHLEAIRRFGPCPIHRKSFEPIKSWYASQQIDFWNGQ